MRTPHRRHKHTRTATHTLAKALLLQGKLLSNRWDWMELWQRWGERGAKVGNFAVPSLFRDVKHCSGGGENVSPESSSHLPCTDKHQASLTRLLSRTDSDCSPWKFLSRPFLCILPSLFWLSVRSWSHHCHGCYDISIFWQVYMLLSLPAELFSTQPAARPELGQHYWKAWSAVSHIAACRRYNPDRKLHIFRGFHFQIRP